MLPPPPIAPKPRNESNSATLPTYRNRPVGNNFSNAKTLFNNLSQPQTKTTISNAVKSPFLQKAVISGVQNEEVRENVVNVAKDEKFKQQLADIIKQFDKSPSISNTSTSIMTTTPKSTLPSHNSLNNYNQQKSLLDTSNPMDGIYNYTTTNYINKPNILPKPSTMSESSSSKKNGNMSIDDLLFGNITEETKKPPPNRPPPPKKKSITSSSSSYSNGFNFYEQQHEPVRDIRTTLNEPFNPYCPTNKYGPGLAALEKNLCTSPEPTMTEPYAVAIYPYIPNHFDEVGCDINDIIILIKEIDEYWVQGRNYRTGNSGIIPLNYLKIKLPLAPVTKNSESPYSSSGYGSSNSLSPKSQNSPTKCISSSNDTMIVCTALYDYNSSYEGDLKFSAGDTIVVHERVSDEWLRGQLGKEFGIFPITFVHIDNIESIPYSRSETLSSIEYVQALYDYNSGTEGDLCFNVGDQIKVVEQINSDWIRGELHGIVGLVPMTYVQKV
uniref:SH3 domain-containing protein n=1 Tax=Parastrongyloides trichosuri TaxID=131310 RepID=A0A0N4Z1W7_PARTI